MSRRKRILYRQSPGHIFCDELDCSANAVNDRKADSFSDHLRIARKEGRGKPMKDKIFLKREEK